MTGIRILPSHTRIAETTAQGLLTRELGPDDVPPAYAGVARLLEATHNPELISAPSLDPAAWRMISSCFNCVIGGQDPAAATLGDGR
jgi:hypothetical protein